jgi:ribosomal protein S18 acetylase RimI-like enzyme
MTSNPSDVEMANLADLEEVLRLFDAVQAWLVARGLREQWGDAPFSAGEAQRERFAAWLVAGSFFVVRRQRRIVGTLVLGAMPPDYAHDALAGRVRGGYLEALAVHRDHAGRGVGTSLLRWAEEEARERGLGHLRLDCWAENQVLRAYYRRAGFAEIADLTLGSWRGTLFEKPIPPAL